MLLSIYNTIENRVGRIDYWRGPASEQKPQNGPTGRSKIIDPFDEYVLTLVYILEGMTMRILADWFGLSRTSVACIINTWINLIYQILKDWLIWPSAEQVKSMLPKNYPEKYADTRVILDCTEFFVLKPKNCSAQASTYYQYKHHNTVKVLIGITPRGLITFVSNPYGGNSSDRHIMETELLEKMNQEME